MPPTNLLQSCISLTFFIGQLLGLTSLCGIFHRDETNLKFMWKSLGFGYTVFIFTGSTLYVQFIIVWMITAGFTLYSLIRAVDYGCCLLNVVLLYKLDMKWPELLKLWRSMEMKFTNSENIAECRKYIIEERRMNKVTIFVIGNSFGKTFNKIMKFNFIPNISITECTLHLFYPSQQSWNVVSNIVLLSYIQLFSKYTQHSTILFMV